MTEHYFSASPQGDSKQRQLEVVLAGAPRLVTTAGGVFSAEGLDRGTAVLLRTLERESDDVPANGSRETALTILDLGCGWGPIALTAALRHPDATVWAVDINERARELTELNARALGLENVRVAAPQDVPDELCFDAIHSNPPIRIGKAALHEMLGHWLPRLKTPGSAHLVVAKHLGADSLQRWIAQTFEDVVVDRAARDKGFHVIRLRRGEPADALSGS